MNILFLLVVQVCVVYGSEPELPELPELDCEKWWGPGSKWGEDTSIREFKVQFDDQMIEDLRYRIKTRRHSVPTLDGVGFSYGFNTKVLDEWMDYWADQYPFAEREAFLNQYPQYKTNIQGLDIHFIWIRPQESYGNEVVPLLILHGFPGSVREFYEAIPLLLKQAELRGITLELVIPSLPGFGFSDGAIRPGLDGAEMAIVLRNLMHRLGHEKFYVQGGDWGSIIGSHISTIFPKEVLGYHTNMPFSMTSRTMLSWLAGSLYPSSVVDPSLESRLYPIGKVVAFLLREFGYYHIQATKPDTIGVAISDSPSGLLAYNFQLIATATRANNTYSEDGGFLNHYSREQLIDNLMLYWSTNSFATAARLYAESSGVNSLSRKVHEIPTPVPTWTIHAKDEIVYQSPYLLRFKYPNLLHATVLEDGGHFLALELPHIYAEDVATAVFEFRRLRDEQ